MQEAAGITLALMMLIMGWFNDGLKALEAKQYDKAVELFTKVQEKNVPCNRYREQALFFRAQAYEEKGDKAKAMADCLALYNGTKDKELMEEAGKLFVELGGDGRLLTLSPTASWNKYIAAIKARNKDEALSYCTGQLKGDLNSMDFSEMRNDPKESDVKVVREEMDPNVDPEHAVLIIMPEGQEIEVRMVLDRKAGHWLVSGFADRTEALRKNTEGNLQNLKNIVQSCHMYGCDHEQQFPKDLETLVGKEISGKDKILYFNPETGTRTPFIYCSGLAMTSSPDLIVAAAPTSVKGKRLCAFVDGRTEEIPEEYFQKKCEAQKWKIEEAKKKK